MPASGESMSPSDFDQKLSSFVKERPGDIRRVGDHVLDGRNAILSWILTARRQVPMFSFGTSADTSPFHDLDSKLPPRHIEYPVDSASPRRTRT
jgi:hypothetical protein